MAGGFIADWVAAAACTVKPVLTQTTSYCTTSIHWQTSPDTNHQSLYYQYTLTDQSWHKLPLTVLPVYTDKPVLTQTTSHCTTSIHWQTSPDTNHQSQYQYTLTDQSWHKPTVTALPTYTDKPFLTQTTCYCTTSYTDRQVLTQTTILTASIKC